MLGVDSARPEIHTHTHIHRQTDFPEDYCNPRHLGLIQNVMLVGMANKISKNYTYKCVDCSRHNEIKGAKAH